MHRGIPKGVAEGISRKILERSSEGIQEGAPGETWEFHNSGSSRILARIPLKSFELAHVDLRRFQKHFRWVSIAVSAEFQGVLSGQGKYFMRVPGPGVNSSPLKSLEPRVTASEIP